MIQSIIFITIVNISLVLWLTLFFFLSMLCELLLCCHYPMVHGYKKMSCVSVFSIYANGAAVQPGYDIIGSVQNLLNENLSNLMLCVLWLTVEMQTTHFVVSIRRWFSNFLLVILYTNKSGRFSRPTFPRCSNTLDLIFFRFVEVTSSDVMFHHKSKCHVMERPTLWGALLHCMCM